MRIIYIAGAYRSKWGFLGVALNIWKARRAAKRLWSRDFAVICPHSNTAFFKEELMYLRGGIEMVKRCDALYLLKGWQSSEGSCLEYRAAIDNNLEVIFEE